MCTCLLSSRTVFIRRLIRWSSKTYTNPYHTLAKNDIHLFCLSNLSKLTRCQTQVQYAKDKVGKSYCTKGDQPKNSGKELDIARENPYAGLITAEKVKEAGKDASYFAVILAGLGIMDDILSLNNPNFVDLIHRIYPKEFEIKDTTDTVKSASYLDLHLEIDGIMFYTVGKELFSSQSPAGVYGQALKKCQENDEVCVAVGEPMTGHGTSGSRRRKQHVSSQEFMVNGVKHMRVVFKIEGPYRKGTVHVEVYQDENKIYQYKYLIVELDGYPSKTIVIENNR